MTVSNEERQYAMGVLAAKGAMRDGTAFAAMIEQAEEVLANEPPEAEAARLRRALQVLADAADTVGIKFFDTDTMEPEVEAMQSATQAARAALK